MKLIKHSIAALALIAGYVMPVQAETTNCTAITSVPTVITEQGVYCLTGNVGGSLASGNMIEIQANNVTIDLNSFVLGGLAAGPGTEANGIFASQRKNITIRNGTIRGFRYAVVLIHSSSGLLVEDIRADRNLGYGIFINADNSIIRNNQIINTGPGVSLETAGLMVAGNGNNRITGNTISSVHGTVDGEDAYGIRLQFGDATLIENNLITDITAPDASTSTGIFIDGGDFVSVRNNNIASADLGIHYEFGTGKYMGNLTSGVTTPFTGGTAVGVNN